MVKVRSWRMGKFCLTFMLERGTSVSRSVRLFNVRWDNLILTFMFLYNFNYVCCHGEYSYYRYVSMENLV